MCGAASVEWLQVEFSVRECGVNHQIEIAPIGAAMSLKARAYEALKSAITRMNVYAPGADLRLDERELSQRFGISRTPLREALAQLDQEEIGRANV